MTSQIKGKKHYFHVSLFIMLKIVVLTFESVDEIHSNVTIQMRATKHYFYVVLFIVLCCEV